MPIGLETILVRHCRKFSGHFPAAAFILTSFCWPRRPQTSSFSTQIQMERPEGLSHHRSIQATTKHQASKGCGGFSSIISIVHLASKMLAPPTVVNLLLRGAITFEVKRIYFIVPAATSRPEGRWNANQVSRDR